METDRASQKRGYNEIMQFGNSTGLWWLAAVPVLVLLLVWAFRARRRALESFAAQPLADRLTKSVRPVARRWKAVLLVAGIFWSVLALAQPRWGFEWRKVNRKGVDVLVLLDVSKSMLTEDVRPNRLTQAKFAVEDLLAKLQGDRAGLIVFAGTAFVQCPLTIDYEACRLALRDADPRIIPRGGSAIGPAIRTALKAFEAGEGRDRAIVLITDGEETEADALAAAEEAAKAGVRIYAIGVGSVEGELIPVREDGKAMEFLKDSEGKVVKSRLDEETLKQLALKTQGIYVRSAAGDFGMETVYEKGIAQLQRKEYEEQLQKKFFERFQWPLGIGLLLLVLEMFVSDRRRVVVLLALCIGGAASQAAESWPRVYNDGVTAYRSNDLATAAAAFERSLAAPEKELQARSLYNLGNTHYRLGQVAETQGIEKALPVYQKSLKDYEGVLAANPKDEDAKFNQELVKKKIEELKKKQEEQQQQQKQDQQKQDKDKQDKDKKDQEQQSQSDQQKQQEQQKQDKPQEDAKKPGDEQKPQEQPAEAQPKTGDNLDKQRAAALLDQLREEERNWNFFPEVQMKDLKDSSQPVKDW
ncbi:MAG: VWA domain-containing protein [Verrucomicrobiota bacterium]